MGVNVHGTGAHCSRIPARHYKSLCANGPRHSSLRSSRVVTRRNQKKRSLCQIVINSSNRNTPRFAIGSRGAELDATAIVGGMTPLVRRAASAAVTATAIAVSQIGPDDKRDTLRRGGFERDKCDGSFINSRYAVRSARRPAPRGSPCSVAGKSLPVVIRGGTVSGWSRPKLRPSEKDRFHRLSMLDSKNRRIRHSPCPVNRSLRS